MDFVFPQRKGFQGTPMHCFPLSSINGGVCAHNGLPTFLLIKMAVIPDYCNGLTVLCAWLIPPVHLPTHPFIDAFASKQLFNTYHST